NIMPKKELAQDTTIDINGFSFETKDCVYEVVPKYDADAPDGFKNYRTTKLLSKSAGRSILSVPYKQDYGLWDTGLYANSPMYSRLSDEDKERVMEKVDRLIVKPYTKIHGEEKLDPTDIKSEFWNYVNKGSFSIEVYKGKIFNTRKPEDRLKLFIAISLGKIAPKQQENEYIYNSAQFCIENKDAVKSIKQENDLQEMKCIYQFQDLLNKKPKKLSQILNYVGVKTPTNMDKGLTTQIFKNYIDRKGDKFDNRSIFLETVDKSSKKDGYNEIVFYSKLQKLYKKGVVTRQGEFFYVNGEELGTNSLKNCASNIIKDKGLQSKIME